MPEKRKTYRAVKFQPNTLRQVEAHLWQTERKRFIEAWKDSEHFVEPSETPNWAFQFDGSVANPDEDWTFTALTEWMAAHKSTGTTSSSFDLRAHYSPRLQMTFTGTQTEVAVRDDSREEVERVFEILETGLAEGALEPNEVSDRLGDLVEIFIAHGRSSAWRDLKDHLQDKHHFSVIAYEIGARAGLSIQEVLEEMTGKAGFALLVHTAEDADQVGDVIRARQNVVHETGLFQGRLGFRRAIILREDGCEGFSNVVGTNELRFAKGHIAEIYGDVLATIHREFGGSVRR